MVCLTPALKMLSWSGGDIIKDVAIRLIKWMFKWFLHKEKQHPSVKIDVVIPNITINIHKD